MSEIHRWFSLGLFVDSVTLLVNYVALWLSSSILSADYNQKDEQWFDFFSQKERRHHTAKLSDLSVREGIKKEPKQVAGETHSFFTRKNFNVKSRYSRRNRRDQEGTEAALLTLYMDYNPYTRGYNFSDLLQSQTGFGSSEAPGFGTQQNPDCNLGAETPVASNAHALRASCYKWTPYGDSITGHLIGSAIISTDVKSFRCKHPSSATCPPP
ncbi:hypothetical protein DY000_02053974 [Brassica cretica]|uniref:Uncharacterized protein n=1 Tax=Brassica cretica TaxID=69181 RepID=A0ABQ7AL82_BRACR|nr:hypothetical protein DY000_02053974 [Brassica cretica]